MHWMLMYAKKGESVHDSIYIDSFLWEFPLTQSNLIEVLTRGERERGKVVEDKKLASL